MDYELLAIVGMVSLVVLVLGARLLGAWDRQSRDRAEHELEMTKLKSGWYRQMQAVKAEKSPKKRRDEPDDDDEEEVDDLDMLIEAVKPYKSLVAGFAASKRVPIDINALMEHDPKEKAKVQLWLESQLKKDGGQLGNGSTEWSLVPA